MSYVNFRVPGKEGTLYSVDFKVYSDEHRIADSGYLMLEPTEEPLAESANTIKDAETWRTVNADIFKTTAEKPSEDSGTGG